MNKIAILLVSLSWMLLAMLSTYFAVRRSTPAFFAVAAALPVGIYLVNHRKLVFMLALATIFSGLAFPGLPATVNVHHLLVIFLIGLGVLGSALEKDNRSPPAYYYLLIAIVLNLGLIIYLRGSGFRALGDSNWGGGRYVDIFLALGLMLFSRTVTLTPKDWKIFFFLFLGLSMMPLLSETIFLLSGGRIYHQYYIVRMNTATVASYIQGMAGQDLIRFQSGNRTGVILAVVAALLFYINPRRKILPAALLIGGLLLVGFSGHRSGLVDLFLISWMVGFYLCKGFRNLYLQATFIGALLGIGLLYFIGPSLPLPFQRALTFLPGIDWSYDAIHSADVTWEWRLNLWREGLREMQMNPSYYLTGKGYTYSGAEYEALSVGNPGEYHYWFAVIMSTYHQGILTLLIGMGIPGLLLFSGFFLFAIRRHIRFARGKWGHTILKKTHTILLTYFIILVLKFYLIYGDLFISLPTLAFWLVLIEALVGTNEQILKSRMTDQREESPAFEKPQQKRLPFTVPHQGKRTVFEAPRPPVIYGPGL